MPRLNYYAEHLSGCATEADEHAECDCDEIEAGHRADDADRAYESEREREGGIDAAD